MKTPNANYKEKQCEDCPKIFPVRTQHFARVTRCILCKAIHDRKRRNLHQRDMRILKRQNKIKEVATAYKNPTISTEIG